MTKSLRALLAGIVDYAGLFPPAQLPLADAIRNFARYLREPDAWMLGRFICPAATLPALDEFAAECFSAEHPVRLSVLGRGGESAAQFAANLRIDLAAMTAFQQAHAAAARVEAFEVRLPANVVADECTADLVRLLAAARTDFAAAGFGPVPMSCEAPLAGDRKRLNSTAAGGIAFHNTKLALEHRGTSADRVTLKLRCGGATPDAFPSVAEVAFVIATCAEVGVPLKFTAGLHHPLPRIDIASGASMHGFLNVFSSATLASLHGWDAAEVAALLAEPRVSQFSFRDECIEYAGHTATPDEIAQLRETAALSFGSCSFDEPRDDLRSLGLL